MGPRCAGRRGARPCHRSAHRRDPGRARGSWAHANLMTRVLPSFVTMALCNSRRKPMARTKARTKARAKQKPAGGKKRSHCADRAPPIVRQARVASSPRPQAASANTNRLRRQHRASKPSLPAIIHPMHSKSVCAAMRSTAISALPLRPTGWRAPMSSKWCRHAIRRKFPSGTITTSNFR